MWLSNNEDDELIQYLLGELLEEDRDRIEDQYFTDEVVHERLLALEKELIDQYVHGDLAQERRNHFEKWFLRSPERRQQLEFARVLARTQV